jgi:hypothetical protein
VDQYRAFEKECLQWAATAATDHERQIFLQMAKAWATVVELVQSVRPLEEALAGFFEQARSGSPGAESHTLQ